MHSILDIDLDYFNLVENPMKLLAEPSDAPNDGPATSVDKSDASGGGRHR